tara:strand:+ start:578 stop:997 length:420 start_codon:yes stop_codon:yes gene_type:complete
MNKATMDVANNKNNENNTNLVIVENKENKENKKKEKKKVKIIYIYRDSHLPYNGWLQSCFNCYIITSKTITFKTIHNKGYLQKNYRFRYSYWEFKVFLCGKCRRKLEDKKNCENIKEYTKFNSICNRYIKNHYGYLFTS